VSLDETEDFGHSDGATNFKCGDKPGKKKLIGVEGGKQGGRGQEDPCRFGGSHGKERKLMVWWGESPHPQIVPGWVGVTFCLAEGAEN